MKRGRFHIVHVGKTGKFERTDPDYVDKRIPRLSQDYDECPPDWRERFLGGLEARDLKDLIEFRKEKNKPT